MTPIVITRVLALATAVLLGYAVSPASASTDTSIPIREERQSLLYMHDTHLCTTDVNTVMAQARDVVRERGATAMRKRDVKAAVNRSSTENRVTYRKGVLRCHGTYDRYLFTVNTKKVKATLTTTVLYREARALVDQVKKASGYASNRTAQAAQQVAKIYNADPSRLGAVSFAVGEGGSRVMVTFTDWPSSAVFRLSYPYVEPTPWNYFNYGVINEVATIGSPPDAAHL